MATQPSEEQGNLDHAEPAGDIEHVCVSVGSTSSQSGGDSDCNQESNPMATQPSEEQGNSNHAEPAADIEHVCVSVGSASSQSGDDLETSEEEVDEPYYLNELFSETSEEEVDEPYYRPLLQAAFKGDWEFATRFFERDAASKMAKITSRSETVLHIAALSAQDQFLENLVELLSPCPQALEKVDCDGCTALHNAVLSGRIRMVKALVTRNPILTQLADNYGRVPFGISAKEASVHKEIAWFLAKNTTDDGPSHPFSCPLAIISIIALTLAGHHDITLYLVGRYPHLLVTTSTSTRHIGHSILHTLAVMESDWPSGTKLNVLEALMYRCIPVDLSYEPTDNNSDPALQCLLKSLWNATKTVVPIIKRVHEVKLKNMAALELAKQVCMAISSMNMTEIKTFLRDGDTLFQATAKGTCEIVKLCIQFFPELIQIRPYNLSLPTCAVQFRQERTLGLFLKLSSTAELSLVPRPTVGDSLDMLRAVALSPCVNDVTNEAGAAFEMQRELQWYKAVESWVIPTVRSNYYFKKQPQDIEMTYWSAFLMEHKELIEKGEKWAKDTANSCMLVSTLIATVLFAAAFTVPRGNVLGQDSFLVFTISDVLGLFSSVTAILLFLAILTSRYEAQDFLYSLPKKIIMGLCFLFLSLAFMLVAFVATLKIVLDKRLEWVLIPITLLASVHVALFIVLQLPLLFQMVKSTYGPSIFRPEGIWDGVKYTKKD